MDSNNESAHVHGVVQSAARWEDTFGFRQNAGFPGTRWTIVAQARAGTETEAAEAMSQLCCSYWYPIYAYARRSGRNREEAEDLTQEFFARLLNEDILASARQEKVSYGPFCLR